MSQCRRRINPFTQTELTCLLLASVFACIGYYATTQIIPCAAVKVNKKWHKTCTYGLTGFSACLTILFLFFGIYKGSVFNDTLLQYNQ